MGHNASPGYGRRIRVYAFEFPHSGRRSLWLSEPKHPLVCKCASVQAVIGRIPAALNTCEKKFHIADLGRTARMRRYENAFLWLGDSMVANICCNSTSPDLALAMSLDSTLFKCYSLDTGLLLAQAVSGFGDP